MTVQIDRPALYYPYIHIRSEHWLKATLLCASAVKRIVPEEYVPEDSPYILKYTEIDGRNGKLLQAVPSYSLGADRSQRLLLRALRQHEKEIKRRYSRDRAPATDQYWVHVAKFNGELLDYLQTQGLAWQSRDPHAHGHRVWYALHPTLGSAIMTTLGLGIASEQKCDIVTPSSQFHETLLATGQEGILKALLNDEVPTAMVTPQQARLDLGQLVVTLTGVNYQALRPEDIPELQASEGFCKFRQLIQEKTRDIDAPFGPEVSPDQLALFEDELSSKAMEIVEAWRDAKAGLRTELKDALFEQTTVLSGEALKAQIKGSNATELAVAGGVSIALLIYKWFRVRRNRSSEPYQYLTEIVQAQNEHLRMTFPLGLEP